MLELFIYLQKMANEDILKLAIITSIVFLIAPAFIIIYIIIYNQRKKKHIEEKVKLKKDFDTELVKAQHEVQEQTMQTIGADLHDNIGQLLSLTSLTLNSIELENEDKAKEKIEASIALTLRSIKEMRMLGKLLQGDQLVAHGLPEAIRHEISWIEKASKYHINYLEDGELPAANNPDKDLIIFRVIQEILNNIMKHAQATKIDIELSYEDKKLFIQITDNGIGFDINNLLKEQMGMGLQNIKKRISIIGGEVAFNSSPGNGTGVSINITYP